MLSHSIRLMAAKTKEVDLRHTNTAQMVRAKQKYMQYVYRYVHTALLLSYQATRHPWLPGWGLGWFS